MAAHRRIYKFRAGKLFTAEVAKNNPQSARRKCPSLRSLGIFSTNSAVRGFYGEIGCALKGYNKNQRA